MDNSPIDASFFTFDPNLNGSKGLVYIGDRIIVYRRDTNTDKYPLCLDLPGGGKEGDETPFQTFQREIKEEFNLSIQESDICYAKRYPSERHPGKFVYFAVVRLAKETESDITFGDEGIEYFMMNVDEFLVETKVWPGLQEKTQAYLQSK